MLQLLSRNEINEEKWNNCVRLSFQNILYAYSWYLDTVCTSWEAVVEDVEGVYVSVFPLPLGKKWGKQWVLQPYFTQQLGLFTTAQSNYTDVNSYLSLVTRRHNNVYLQLNTCNSISLPYESVFTSAERITYHLDLNKNYAVLLKNYRNRHKLHKAQRTGLKVKPLEDIDVITSIFKETKGRELQEVKSKHYKLLSKLYSILKEHDSAKLLQVVNSSGITLAAALFLIQPGKIIFLFSASSAEGRQTAAMTLLLDHVIQKFADSNIILDFEGSIVPSVAKFYANFGAIPVSYVSISKQIKPWYLKWKEAISTY